MKTTKINIYIEATFGSDFQKEFGLGSLEQVLKAWEMYLLNSHKHNKIKVAVDKVNSPS